MLIKIFPAPELLLPCPWKTHHTEQSRGKREGRAMRRDIFLLETVTRSEPISSHPSPDSKIIIIKTSPCSSLRTTRSRAGAKQLHHCWCSARVWERKVNLPRKSGCEISARRIWVRKYYLIISFDFIAGQKINIERKSVKFLIVSQTCAGADIRPTAIPQTTRPKRIIRWLSASAIDDQPTISGNTDISRVVRRPKWSMIGTELRLPIGVARECIEA